MPAAHAPTTVHFTAGETIFAPGDQRQALYVIQKGQIAIYKTAHDGTKLPLSLVASGEYLGETGLLDNKAVHMTWAVALTDVEAIRFSADAILEQVKQAPSWLVALTKGLAQKVRKMNDLVRRNNVIDEQLMLALQAVEENERQKSEQKAEQKDKKR